MKRLSAAITLGALVVLIFASARCRRAGPALAGSRSSTFAAARLATQFHKDPATKRSVPLFHVLFVPQWEVPRGVGYGTTGGSGGTSERLRLDYSYRELRRDSPAVNSQPVYILNGRTLSAAGRTFDLGTGNIFVADVNLDGTLRITQLSSASLPHDSPSASVLTFIKHALPANKRVQELKSEVIAR